MPAARAVPGGRTPRRLSRLGLLAALLLALVPDIAGALTPEEVLVVANRRFPHSVELARHYLSVRGIPRSNLVRLSLSTEESVGRSAYESTLLVPLREALLKKGRLGRITCLVLIRGVPLKIAPEEAASAPLSPQDDTAASVDSELALALWGPYPLRGWIPNPRCQAGTSAGLPGERVLLVARLDAPTPACVRGMIDAGLQTERTGLEGVAYLDARWKARSSAAPSPASGAAPSGEPPAEDAGAAYRRYDLSLHKAAITLGLRAALTVVLDERPPTFPPASCPQAALYCGWYSLGRYVDAFDWVPGAVGYHIASAECVTLRDPESQAWCPRLLMDGACATLGPVGEPFVQAFPLPERFFGLLVEEGACLGEAYLMSLPYLSWKMVLLGDPLYRPFAGS